MPQALFPPHSGLACDLGRIIQIAVGCQGGNIEQIYLCAHLYSHADLDHSLFHLY